MAARSEYELTKKIFCIRMEHLLFLDSVSFLPMVLRKIPEAFGLTASKSWYPNNFKNEGLTWIMWAKYQISSIMESTQ
jgi:hypothetical protein